MNMHDYMSEFQPDDLVTWHESYDNKSIPVPGVVIRQESNGMLIKACVGGVFKELYVSPQELVSR